MAYEISDAQVAAFRSQDFAVIEAYLKSKEWQRNSAEYGPRNIWYQRTEDTDLCPYCDDPGDPINEDPYCPVHDDATWTLLWPRGVGTTVHEALYTLCRVENRGPEEILHALTLRDHDEVRAKCGTPLWQQIRTPERGNDFFVALAQVLAAAAGPDPDALDESLLFDDHPYTVELVSDSEVLFSFPHDGPPTRGESPSASRHAAHDLYSAACSQAHPSDRLTRIPVRYGTGEWTTVDVLGPADLPLPTTLQNQVSSLIHQFGLKTWTFDRAYTAP